MPDQQKYPRWTRSPTMACALALLLWATSVPAKPLPERQVIAITDVTVIDVEHSRSIGPRTVLIEDGRIAAIDKLADARIPANAQRIAGRGRFLIPGLVDMHVHLFNNASHRPPNEWSFPLFVANGVTAVREMNTLPAAIVQVNQWRQRLEESELVAPRILAAGVAVQGSSPRDAADQVKADAGADFIKVFSDVPAAHWHAILDAAKARGLPVAGHVPAGVPLLVAAAAGQRTDEHLMQAFEACSTIEAQLLDARRDLDAEALVATRDAQEARALDAFDRVTCERVGKSLAATGQVQVPTLVLPYEESIRTRQPPGDDPRWRYLRADERVRWQRILAGTTSQDDALAERRWSVARQIVTAFHRARVPMFAGTDTPMPGVYPGFSLHEELALLVASGLTPREALRSGTLAPAEFLGIAATSGSVTVGKRADLVLLDADPSKDIRNTRRIHAVLLDGRLLRRSALDALLEAAATKQTP